MASSGPWFQRTNEFPNMGKVWSTSEKKQLLEEVKEGTSLKDLSTIHGRTVNGIRGQLLSEARNMYSQGMSIEEIIATLVHLDKADITRTLERNMEKTKPSVEKEKTTKTMSEEESSFRILWDFKLFMMDRIEFDPYLHSIFDDYVRSKMK